MLLTSGLLLVNCALIGGLAMVAWYNRSTVGARLFLLLQAGALLWTALTLVGLWLDPGPLRVRVWGLTTGGSLLVSGAWFAFILGYTGRENWLRARRFGPVALPLAVGGAIYAFTPRWEPLIADLEVSRIGAGTVIDASIGPVGALLGVYLYLVFAAGLVLVLLTVLRGNRLFLGQASALVLGALATVVASAAEIAGLGPAPGYPLTEVSLGVQSALLAYAVFHQEFLRLVPAVAQIGERAVFTDLDDGLLVVDTDGIVLKANPQARSILGEAVAVGEPIEPLFDRTIACSLSDLPCRFRQGSRHFDVRESSISDWRGEPIGHALVIRDVTQLVRHRQRLQVLNRILRHNVRNDVTVIRGVAEEIGRRHDGRIEGLSETIVKRADELATISEKARDVEYVFDESIPTESVDLDALLEDTVGGLESRNATATVSVSVAVDTLQTNRALLALILEEIVENAVVHAGPAPAVEVEVRATETGVRVVVADDGPGIPDSELRPLRAGEETALRHGSSLGLWLVYWGTAALGGDLDVESDDTGSTVTMTIPDATDATTSIADAD